MERSECGSEINAWLTSKLLVPPEWPVKAVTDDRLYDLYGNRNVNVESRVAKERNAQHVIITSANATMTQIGLQIAMNDHFVSEFYARMFTAVLSLWVSIGIV